MSEFITTEGIVLHKTDYLENSVIVSVLTFDCGVVNFMVKGDRKFNKKHTPKFDTLRVLSLTFALKENKNLQTVKVAEVIRVYSNLSCSYRAVTAALWVANLLNRNLSDHHAVKPLYSVLRGMLERLDHEKPSKSLCFAEVVGFAIYFLMFEGLIPEDYLAVSAPHLQPFYENLFKEVKLPELSVQDRHQLSEWLTTIIHLLNQRAVEIPDCLLS